MVRELGAALRTQISRSSVLKGPFSDQSSGILRGRHFQQNQPISVSRHKQQRPEAGGFCSGLCKATPVAEGIHEPGQLMKDRSHDEVVAELFQADPFYAAELLAEVLQDGSADELAILERQLSVAFATREINPNSRKF